MPDTAPVLEDSVTFDCWNSSRRYLPNAHQAYTGPSHDLGEHDRKLDNYTMATALSRRETRQASFGNRLVIQCGNLDRSPGAVGTDTSFGATLRPHWTDLFETKLTLLPFHHWVTSRRETDISAPCNAQLRSMVFRQDSVQDWIECSTVFGSTKKYSTHT